ncbi:hypothetical protein J2X69_002409 [Algoriphagus sp. 4150]|uniref:hypothetical protein n=1 Tax=Algoriphagus sp. 4150 TaxID=2817756 RepID=UPI00285513E8|nr:hypothetical protein [Algoriphagus sp. 4150]MDR7130062.1 hypothetical protein [Algoriphagus sp. 4150]
MNKYVLILIAQFYLSISGFSQVYTNPTTGDVGIGTSSPLKKLHVIGDTRIQRSDAPNYLDFLFSASATTIRSDHPGTNQKHLIFEVAPTGASATDRHIYFRAGKSSDTMLNRMIIRGDGNIGIGNINPTYKLEVTGNTKWTGNASSFTEVNSNTNGQYLRQYGNDGTSQSWLIRGYSGTDGVQAFFNNGGVNVNGRVKAKEVNVTAIGWADYVFDNDYKLLSLEEVKDFYTAHGHLPNIPSEKEVEENGINISELSSKYLEKIEELTIYLVQQNERIKTLEAQLRKLTPDTNLQ